MPTKQKYELRKSSSFLTDLLHSAKSKKNGEIMFSSCARKFYHSDNLSILGYRNKTIYINSYIASSLEVY